MHFNIIEEATAAADCSLSFNALTFIQLY